MKRNFGPKLIAATAALLLLFALSATAYAADSSVTYNGTYAGSLFGFAPDDGSSGGNGLFSNLQNLMPGGTYTQKVTIKNTSYQQANLYLRGEASNATVEDLLSKITFTVTADDGTPVVSSATPMSSAWPGSGTATGSGTFVPLGTFVQNTTKTLTVTLNVPATLGNEYQNAKGSVKWIFQADVYTPPVVNPTPTPTSTIPLGPGIEITTGGNKIPLSPGTGDNANYLLWGAGAVVLAAGLVVLVIKRRKA